MIAAVMLSPAPVWSKAVTWKPGWWALPSYCENGGLFSNQTGMSCYLMRLKNYILSRIKLRCYDNLMSGMSIIGINVNKIEITVSLGDCFLRYVFF